MSTHSPRSRLDASPCSPSGPRGTPSPKASRSPKAKAKAKAKAKSRATAEERQQRQEAMKQQKELKAKAKAEAKAKAKQAREAEKSAKAALRAAEKATKAKAAKAAKAKAKPCRTKPLRAVATKAPKRKLCADSAEAVTETATDASASASSDAQVLQLLGGRSQLATNLAAWVSRQVGLDRSRVAGAVRLFREGNTLPFIARYRKEQTGSMNEEELRRVEREMQRADAVEERRARAALALHRSGVLTPDLCQALLGAEALEEIEDLWAPYRTKRQTRAQLAKARGLDKLAALIKRFALHGTDKWPEEAASEFIHGEVADAKAALAGARDVLAEQCAQKPAVKQMAREALERKATFHAKHKAGTDEEGHFKTYWSFEAPLARVRPHQFLAMQRGEASKALSLGFSVSQEVLELLVASLVATCLDRKAQVDSQVRTAPTPIRARSTGASAAWEEEVRLAMADASKRLLLPCLEREWRRRLRENAEDEAFDTYRRNLKAKLLAPPLRLHPPWGSSSSSEPVTAVLGLDPAFRTGCKCALISVTGQVQATKTLFPHASYAGATVPAHQAEQAASGLSELLELGRSASCPADDEPQSKKRRLSSKRERSGRLVCAIGNGTASRETEAWLRQQLRTEAADVAYSIVDEAGASVYSASPLASKELSELDVSMRGAVSIARRLLDPLSELVKIDPQSIGVGLYQHDVDQKRLAQELKGGTEDCVNAVGVDLNTASAALLEHVAGLSSSLAKLVISYRVDNGFFRSREELKAVRGIGPRIFQQCAGFLRVHGGLQFFDELPIHPESYGVAQELQQRCGWTGGRGACDVALAQRLRQASKDVTLADELGIGVETLADIATALAHAAQGGGKEEDPRHRQPMPLVKVPSASSSAGCKADAAADAQELGLSVQELTPGLRLQGVVRNVVAFGAFVDVGVGHDGLLHVSNYPASSRPGQPDGITVNDRIEVKVLSVEARAGERGKQKWRIGLSMR